MDVYAEFHLAPLTRREALRALQTHSAFPQPPAQPGSGSARHGSVPRRGWGHRTGRARCCDRAEGAPTAP